MARSAEGAERGEIELIEVTGLGGCVVVCNVRLGDLRRTAIYGRSADAEGWAVVHVVARGGAAGVVGGNGEGLVLGVILGFDVCI